MRTAGRALRNVARSPLRSAQLVVVLAVSTALTLIMLTVYGSFGQRLEQIKGRIGTTVTVRPPGSGGFGGLAIAVGPDATTPVLQESDLEGLESLEHVVSVERSYVTGYQGDDLKLVLSQEDLQKRGVVVRGGPPSIEKQIPILLNGMTPTATLTTVDGNPVDVTAGRALSGEDAGRDVAVVGLDVAEQNGLVVGDTFQLRGVTLEVIGIFDAGTQFDNAAVFLPLGTLQRILDAEGEVTQVRVRADSTEHVDEVEDAVRALLGEDRADVTSDASLFEGIRAPVEDARRSSLIGLLAAVVASGAVIVLAVVLVSRQRIKEIGILKAVGATSGTMVTQFGVEALSLSVVAGILGALATFPLAQVVADGLLSDPAMPAPSGSSGLTASKGAAIKSFQVAGGLPGHLSGVLPGSVDVVVEPVVFLYALAIGAGLAVMAAAVSAWYVGRVRPAEVLRYE
ncbi:MAG TPA: ABC transporter permease [Dehalococcoidia bacterium]